MKHSALTLNMTWKKAAWSLLVPFFGVLMGCAGKPSAPASPATASKDPALIGQTSAGPVYAFSYDEDNRHVACQTQVKLDKQQQIISTQRWAMTCVSMPLKPVVRPVAKRLLDLRPEMFSTGGSTRP